MLDLFAGTGALGIEALSRGARELVAVESSAPAAALIAQTLTALKHNRSWEHGMSARVVKARAEKYAASASAEKIASLVRSVVGRVPDFGVVNATPLNRPEITRIRTTLAWRA